MKSLNEFDEVFEALLFKEVKEGVKDKQIVPERYAVLHGVYEKVASLFDVAPQIKLFPNFLTGSVAVEVSSIHLGHDEALRLKNILSECNTFEIVPLKNGMMRIAATVKGVFKATE